MMAREAAMTSAENFGQLRLKFTDPIQHEYKVIHPLAIMLL
jgi:hypothetical protein